MPAMYAKIFLKIFDSSIAEDWRCRIVFQDILILANRDGVVDMTHEAIARRTNVPIELVRESILKLESPDPKSNTPDDEGRRLERLDGHRDWGWRIINYERYRVIKNSEEMRAATRERVARWRAEQKKREAALTAGTGSTMPGNTDKKEMAIDPAESKRQVDAAMVFEHLNELTGSKFRSEGSALAMLRARMTEKEVTTEGIFQMINRQVKLWKDDPKMVGFLRPKTLFNSTNFNEYYAARELRIPNLGTGKANARNFGIVGETSYEGAKPKRPAWAGEKGEVAGQTFANGPAPSSVGGGAGVVV